MKSFAVLALAGAALAAPQATPASGSSSVSFSHIAPKATDPAGCTSSYNGQFEISVVNVSTTSTKRSVKRQSTALEVTLVDGVLTDAKGRIGYIASNQQFQFDYGAQAGAIYTTGWSACANGTLAIGDDAVFYECLSGTFYNLYDEATAAQCSQVYIDIIGSGSASSAAATESTDGQVTASPVTAPISQITDGQIQATTSTAMVPVSQITDGQIQATTATAAPITQISDGQIQATTGAVVSQISDGQIQATTATPATAAVVTQISDGQIQATTAKYTPVSQISDGQIQAPTNGTKPTSATATPSAFTGAAAIARPEFFGLAAGLLAVVAL